MTKHLTLEQRCERGQSLRERASRNHILARAHARAGGLAPEISGYLGRSGRFAEAIVSYANNYADQVERDFDAFRSACRKGRLVARTEADFRADFAV